MKGFTYLVVSPACKVAKNNENAQIPIINLFIAIDLFSNDFYHPAVQLLGSKHFQSHIHQILS